MKNKTASLIIIFMFLNSACMEARKEMGQQQALTLVWEDLEPHTNTKNREKWEIREVSKVYGRDVVPIFVDARFNQCPGPLPPENQAIKPSTQYWFIHTMPHPATPLPLEGTNSPTAPPLIPEPFLREAYYLVDPISYEIIARKFVCVVY